MDGVTVAELQRFPWVIILDLPKHGRWGGGGGVRGSHIHRTFMLKKQINDKRVSIGTGLVKEQIGNMFGKPSN